MTLSLFKATRTVHVSLLAKPDVEPLVRLADPRRRGQDVALELTPALVRRPAGDAEVQVAKRAVAARKLASSRS